MRSPFQNSHFADRHRKRHCCRNLTSGLHARFRRRSADVSGFLPVRVQVDAGIVVTLHDIAAVAAKHIEPLRCHFLVNLTALAARLAGREPAARLDQCAAMPRSLVFQGAQEVAHASIGGMPRAVHAHHAFDVERFDLDGVGHLDDLAGRLVHGVLADVGNLLVQQSDATLGILAPVAALDATADAALIAAQRSQMLVERLRALEADVLLAIEHRRQRLDAHVDADAFHGTDAGLERLALEHAGHEPLVGVTVDARGQQAAFRQVASLEADIAQLRKANMLLAELGGLIDHVDRELASELTAKLWHLGALLEPVAHGAVQVVGQRQDGVRRDVLHPYGRFFLLVGDHEVLDAGLVGPLTSGFTLLLAPRPGVVPEAAQSTLPTAQGGSLFPVRVQANHRSAVGQGGVGHAVSPFQVSLSPDIWPRTKSNFSLFSFIFV